MHGEIESSAQSWAHFDFIQKAKYPGHSHCREDYYK